MVQYMSESETAKFIGLKSQTLRNWRNLKKGPPFFKVEGSIRYEYQDVVNWMNWNRIEFKENLRGAV
jgi:hypothetical protein